MELREALTQITEIRLQLARTEVFRGYRAMPVAFTGAVALLAALIQSATIKEPSLQIGSYLTLWIGAAVVSGLAAGIEMLMRARDAALSLRRAQTWLAYEHFLPCVAAGRARDGRCRAGRTRKRPDAPRFVADLLQPGDLRVLPAVAPADVLGGRLLSRNGPGCSCTRAGRDGAFSLDDGVPVWSGPVAGRRRALLHTGA